MKFIIAFAFFFALSCSQKQTIPPVKLQTLEGKQLSLKELKGKKVVIYVWSRTCVGHAKDLKLLNEISKKRKDLYVLSYAVAMVKEDVIKSYKEIGIKPDFITVLDPEVKFNEYYRIVFLPSTFIFDEKGVFIGSYPGLPQDKLSSLRSSPSSSFSFSFRSSDSLTSISSPTKSQPFVKG